MNRKGLPSSYNFRGDTKECVLKRMAGIYGALMPVKKVDWEGNMQDYIAPKTGKVIKLRHRLNHTHVYVEDVKKCIK